MSAIIEFLADANTQAVFWGLCVVFSVFFAQSVKRMSFGDDVGTRAWTTIALGLFLIGFRVSFKVIFSDYKSSYELQIARFSIGMMGIIILYIGFIRYQSTLREMYGVAD